MCKKSIDKIPIGLYCYDDNGVCPYWSIDPRKPYQENGHCSFCNYGDWETDGWISLLWDQVKECGFNMDEKDGKMPNKINYMVGDATKPQADGNKIIAHICNDIGAFGKGFVLAIDRRWPSVKTMYKGWYSGARLKNEERFGLGRVQLVKVEKDIWVANMIAQKGIYSKNGVPPIRYHSVRSCLKKLAKKSKELDANIHMPYLIGCGLAGGKKSIILNMIKRELNEFNVYLYNLYGKF